MTRARRRIPREEKHASLLFAAPLALVYHFGLLVTDIHNGADTLTSALLFVVDRSVLGYVALLVALTGALYALAHRLEERTAFKRKDILRVVVEALALGLGMRLLVGFLTARVLAVPPLLLGSESLSPVDVLVISAGAGFHEEVLFRGVLFGGGTYLLMQLGHSAARSLLVAALVSSVLFSLAHYVGPLGDPFALGSFVYRTLSGLYLAAVFHYRGFAVAAWTHALYDVGVLL